MAELKTGTTLGSNNVATSGTAPSVRFGTEDFSFYSQFPSGVYANNSVIFKDSNGAVQLGTIVGELDVTITKSPTANSEVEGNTIVYSASASPVPLVQGRTINYHLSGTYSPSDLSPSSNVGSFVFPASSPGVATSTTYTVVADGAIEGSESLTLTLTNVYPAISSSTTLEDPPITYGYVSGGYVVSPSFVEVSGIQKWPFASDTDASNIGNLQTARYDHFHFSSTTHAYAFGGVNQDSSFAPLYVVRSIEKFPFSSDTNATSIGDVTFPVPSPFPNSNQASYGLYGASCNDTSYGYAVGGNFAPPYSPVNPSYYKQRYKISFVSDVNAQSITGHTSPPTGYANGNAAGGQSPTHGYFQEGAYAGDVQKFSFSTETGASFVGSMTHTQNAYGAGISTPTDFLVIGGYNGSSTQDQIDRFPFSSDVNATDVGEMTQARQELATSMSSTMGYYTAGTTAATYRFPFSSFTTHTSVGSLTTDSFNSKGHQGN
jgi:hypothetical protein